MSVRPDLEGMALVRYWLSSSLHMQRCITRKHSGHALQHLWCFLRQIPDQRFRHLTCARSLQASQIKPWHWAVPLQPESLILALLLHPIRQNALAPAAL